MAVQPGLFLILFSRGGGTAGFGEASSCFSEGALELAGVHTGSVTLELQCSGKPVLEWMPVSQRTVS